MRKSWMENHGTFSPKPDNIYPISWFRESFSFLAAMLCRLYGIPNCIVFKGEWEPLAHHVLTIGEYFNWAYILLVVIK